MKLKQQIKSMVCLLQSPYNSSHSSQNYVFKNHPPLPQIFPFRVVPSHIIVIQNKQEFKIHQLQCSMNSPCPKCHVHLNHVIILPL